MGYLLGTTYIQNPLKFHSMTHHGQLSKHVRPCQNAGSVCECIGLVEAANGEMDSNYISYMFPRNLCVHARDEACERIKLVCAHPPNRKRTPTKSNMLSYRCVTTNISLLLKDVDSARRAGAKKLKQEVKAHREVHVISQRRKFGGSQQYIQRVKQSDSSLMSFRCNTVLREHK